VVENVVVVLVVDVAVNVWVVVVVDDDGVVVVSVVVSVVVVDDDVVVVVSVVVSVVVVVVVVVVVTASHIPHDAGHRAATDLVAHDSLAVCGESLNHISNHSAQSGAS